MFNSRETSIVINVMLAPGWTNRKNYLSLHSTYDDYSELDELEDDVRPSAEAIQLIRSYSLCGLEMRFNYFKKDTQFVTMHRLVQEIIRMNLSSKSELDWVKKYLSMWHSDSYREWSTGGSAKRFQNRERFIGTLWTYCAGCKELSFLFVRSINQIWKDACPGYLPALENTVLKNILGNVTSDGIVHSYSETFILQKYILQNELNHRLGFNRNDPFPQIRRTPEYKFLGNGFISDDLFTLYCKVPPENPVSYDVLSLVLMQVSNKEYSNLGHSLQNCIENMQHILFRLMNLMAGWPVIEEPIDSEISIRCVLILAGRILELMENFENQQFLENLSRFCCLVAEKLNTLCIPGLKHLFRMIQFSLLGSSNVDSSLNKLQQEFDDKVENPELKSITSSDAYTISLLIRVRLTSCPAPLAASLFHDIILEPEFVTITPFDNLVASLKKIKNFKVVEKILIEALLKAYDLCTDERYSSAQMLITAANLAELDILWKNEMYNSSAAVCKLLPPLCKFNAHFDYPNMVPDWMDDFILRASLVGFELEGPLLALEDVESICPSDNNPVSLRTVVLKLPSNAITVVSPGNMILHSHQKLWDTKDYTGWLQNVQQEVSSLEDTHMQGYTEAKIAEELCYMLVNCKSFEEIPTTVVTWATLYLLEHHSNIKQTGLQLVSTIRDIIKTANSPAELTNFTHGLITLGKIILENQKNKERVQLNSFHLVQLNNLWYILNALAIITEENCYTETSITWFEALFDVDGKVSKSLQFYQVVNKLKHFGEHADTDTFPIICTLILSLVKQYDKFEGAESLLGLHRLIDSFVAECFRFSTFKEIVQLCQGLEKAGEVKATTLIAELAQYYTIRNVGKRYKYNGKNWMFVDCLRLYRTALKIIDCPNFKQGLLEELRLFLNEINKFYENDEDISDSGDFGYNNMEKLYVFLLKYGDESFSLKQLLFNILNIHFNDGDFMSIYDFGLTISRIRMSSIVLQTELDDGLEEIVYCLRCACEQNSDRVKGWFEHKLRSPWLVEDNRKLFIDKVDEVLKEFGVEMDPEVDEDPEDSDDFEESLEEIGDFVSPMEGGTVSELGLD
ncbi:uncharacterized protein LOC118437169 [Folsomia candida]|uniref:uncharacterized protein LOC118437169 n=1 Tax=Folsomia candida TaxID=158441 RepID=UPI00160545C1|nr:uncharacterized protein LOC118437169 [Folsomia candida]